MTDLEPGGALTAELAGNFVAVNLGAGGDPDYSLPSDLLGSLTLVAVDAADESRRITRGYHARHSLRAVVDGSSGRRVFRENRYVSCSSLREPLDGLVEKYGLEEFYEVVDRREVECETLPVLLGELGLDHVDFLKTDVEGADFDVLQASEPLLAEVTAIKCELRFEPFYEGEPYFHEAAAWLHEQGFDLIGLQPESWRPVTRNRAQQRDGQVVWADCAFTRRPDKLKSRLPLDRAKHVLTTSMLGHRAHAEQLLESYEQTLPGDWVAALRPAVEPLPPESRTRAFARRVARAVAYRVGGPHDDLNWSHVVPD